MIASFHPVSLLLALFISALLPVQAQQRPGGTGGVGGGVPPRPEMLEQTRIRFSVTPILDLGAIGVGELLDGGPAQKIPFSGSVPLAPYRDSVERVVPSIWRLRLPPGVDPGSVQVAYELRAANGQYGAVSSLVDATSTIPIGIFPDGRPVIQWSRGTTVVRGGAVFRLDVSRVRRAGGYLGRLVVVMSSL